MIESGHVHQAAVAPTETESGRYRRICRAMLFAGVAYFLLIATSIAVVVARVDMDTQWKPSQVDQLINAMWVHGGTVVFFMLGLHLLGRLASVRERHAKIVLLACSLGGILSLDRFAGIAFPPPSRHQGIFQPHPVRGWAHRPGIFGLFGTFPDRVNALGMRGPEIPAVKPKGQTRVLVVGDSIVVGYLMPAGDTPVDHLNQRARLRGPDANVLFMNGGCAGHATWQELDFIRNEGIKTQPDVLILVFCFNDMTELIGLRDGSIFGMADVNPVPKIDYISGLVRAGTTLYDDWRMQRIRDAHQWVRTNPFVDPDSGLRRKEDLYVQPPGRMVTQAWERACRDLDAVNEFCSEQKLPWMLVAYPTRQLLDGEVDANGFAPLKRWAEAAGVHYYDPAPDFRIALAGRPAETLMMDDLHPNKEGSLLTADLLLHFMSERGILHP